MKSGRFRVKKDIAANWTSANPVLKDEYLGIETDTNKMKIGDGHTAWNSLKYFVQDASDSLDTAVESVPKVGIYGASSTSGSGAVTLKTIAASKTLTNARTNTLALQIPSGAKILGVQLRNDTIIAGVDDATGLTPITTYSAIYATGATQTINASVAVAKNTKVNKFFDANAATDITSGATDITLDAGSGNKFTAGGIISAVAYYYEFTSLTSL